MKQMFQSGKDVERAILERPVFMCIHMHTGIADKINENGEIMAKISKELIWNALVMAYCIAIAVAHMTMIVFYPIVKVRQFLKIRRMVREKPGCIKIMEQFSKTE